MSRDEKGRRRTVFVALASLLLAAVVFGLSFVVGPTTNQGKLQTAELLNIPATTLHGVPEPGGNFGSVPPQGEVTASFRFQLEAPAGPSTLFNTFVAAARIQRGPDGQWTMVLQFPYAGAGDTFPIVSHVDVGRWYAVTVSLANQDHISATVNGRPQFDLTLPPSSFNYFLGDLVLGSPKSGTAGGVAVQNFKISERTDTVTSPIAQTTLRLIAGLLLAATVVLLVLFFITSDRSRRLVGLAPASGYDERSTLLWRARIQTLHRWKLALGLAALAAGVTLLVVATPPENNVEVQTGHFHLTLPNTEPRTENTIGLGSLAAVGRSTATMDSTLSFQMDIGRTQRSNQASVVTTQKNGNGIEFYLDSKRQLWGGLTYGPSEGLSTYQLSNRLPVGRWTSVKVELTRGQKLVFFVNGATVGYQEFSAPGWQGAAQVLSAGSNSARSDVSIKDISLVERLYSAPVPRTEVFFLRSLQVLGFLLVAAGAIVAANRVLRSLFSSFSSTSRPLILVVFGVAGLGILINFLIDVLHLQSGSVPYVTRNTWIFSHYDSFTDFLNPLEIFIARDAYSTLGASSYPPVAYWLVSPFYWIPPFGALFVYIASFSGFFLWWLWRSALTSLKALEIGVVGLVAVTSFPFTYAISRANIDISLFVMFAILVACLERERFRAAASLIGLAIAAKVVPALFLVVFFRRLRWRYLWLALSVTAVSTLLAFLWFGGGFTSNVHHFFDAFTTSQKSQGQGWSPIDISFGTNLSVWAQSIGYVITGVQGGSDVAQIMQYIELPIEVLGALLLVLYVKFIDGELWRIVTLIVTAILLLPTPSGDYELLYLFVPIALFLRYAHLSQRHLFIAALFGLLLAPRVYFFVGDYFVGTDTLLTAPILVFLSVLVVRDGFAERSGRRRMLPVGAVAFP